jgi:hypothetical protein
MRNPIVLFAVATLGASACGPVDPPAPSTLKQDAASLCYVDQGCDPRDFCIEPYPDPYVSVYTGENCTGDEYGLTMTELSGAVHVYTWDGQGCLSPTRYYQQIWPSLRQWDGTCDNRPNTTGDIPYRKVFR